MRISRKYVSSRWNSKAIALCSLIFFISLSSLFAQISNPHFVRINASSGLASDNVLSILQDKDGYIWLSTKNGLSHYDGSKMSTFVYKPQDRANPVVEFTAMLQDQSGDFWLGSYGGMLLKYSSSSRKFTRFQVINFKPKNNPITILYEDEEGFIWIGNNSAQLWRFNKESGQYITIRLPKNEGKDIAYQIKALREDNKDNLWIATNCGFFQYGKKKGDFTHFQYNSTKSSLSDNHVNCLAFDGSNQLWLGTNKGLDSYNPQTLEYTHFGTKEESGRLLSGDKINALFVDSNSQLWVGTNKGLNLKRKDGKGFQFFRYKEYQDNSLPSNYVSDIFEDKSKHLWVATQNGGVGILDLNPKSINTEKFVEQINALITTEITTVFYDKISRSLWLGTDSEGIYHFLLKNAAYPYAYYNSESKQLKSNAIKRIFIDSNRYLWIVYEDGSFDVKKEKGNSLLPDSFLDKYPLLKNEKQIQELIEDDEQRLWFGLDDRILAFSAKTNKVVGNYPFKQLFPNVTEPIKISAITQDYRNNIWIGTASNGICILNPISASTKRYSSNPNKIGSLGSNRIQVLYEDHKGVMWCGTADGGLEKFDRINSKFESFTKEDGLISSNISSLLEDRDDQLWIGTSAGLNRLDQTNKSIALFNTMDGLKSNAFVRNAATQGKNGDLYFITQRGFNAFSTQTKGTKEGNFNLVFTDFTVNNISILDQKKDSSLQRQFLDSKIIHLKPDQRNIGIEFSALEYLNPDNINYYYQLEGVDNEWVNSKKNNFVSYINLTPGKYVFNLKATDKTGEFTPFTTTLIFDIATPIYQQGWFVLSLIFFVLMSILFFIRLRINRIRIRNRMLEEQVKNKTKELLNSNFQLQKEIDERIKAEADAERASKSKSQFLANMSHEIRTPMNAIIGFTDLLTSLVKEEKQRYYLSSIRSSGKSLLVLINDILDLSKIEAGQFKIDYRPVNLVHLFEEIKQVFALKCDEKDLLFNLTFDKDIPKSLIMSEIRIRQVLVNLIGNALKFTEKGSVGLHAKINASAMSENKINLLIEVSDTGIGIDSDQQKKIFQAFHQTEGQDVRKYGGTGLGLSISKRLVELMDGKLDVESVLGSGSTFKIYLNNVEISDEDVVYNDKSELNTTKHHQFKSSKLLVVDDSKTNRSLIVELFRDSAIKVFEAGNGQEAVEKTIELLPDLVLMDIRMPVLNGYDAVKLIRENDLTKAIPVFALTASISNDAEDKYQKAGFDHVLLKPLDMETLLLKIAEYLPYEDVAESDKIQLEQSEVEAQEEEISKATIEMALIDLKALLPLQKKLQQEKFINDILLFTAQIKMIGERYAIGFIIKYAETFRFQTENFDTEKMEKSLNSFPNIIVELENRLKE